MRRDLRWAALPALVAGTALLASCGALLGLGDYTNECGKGFDETCPPGSGGSGGKGAGGSGVGASGGGGGSGATGGGGGTGGQGGTPDHCGNGTRDGNETDIDCGGECQPCDNGKGCDTGADCLSRSCPNHICIAGTCTDGIQNGPETDIDCGGPGPCARCGDGQSCMADADCAGMGANRCTNNKCHPTCMDGAKNGHETDVDCGGDMCPGCTSGQSCTASTDCATGLCDGGHCGTITSVSVGHQFACALSNNGNVFCWGYNGAGFGDGSMGSPLPKKIDFGGPVMALGLRNYTACVVTSGGGVKCWGSNFYGQIGDGTLIDRPSPTDVSGLSSGIVDVSPGGLITCALTVNGTVKCWGANESGELGDGITTHVTCNGTDCSKVPVNVSGLTNATAITTGGGHACVLKGDQTFACWGDNSYGELGIGTTVSHNTPVAVPSLSGFWISAGDETTCAVDTSQDVRCWGYGAFGQLGNGATGNSSTPVVTGSLGGSAAYGISVGFGGFACAPNGVSNVWCWGDNMYGGLGNGTYTRSSSPVQVVGLQSGTAVSAGGLFTCALSQGHVKCWGFNGQGQLGDGVMTHEACGTQDCSSTPVNVAFP
jgi:alpha-tubulin suppressor-like RCC1 family protein